MNKKLLSIILVFLSILSVSSITFAEDEKDKVEPNVYKKRDINIRNNFRDNLNERKELPEEQKELTFEPPRKTEKEQISEELFQSSVIETNTITSKATQLELFSMADYEAKRDTEEEVLEESSILLIIFMIIIVAIVIVMIFLLVPRLQHNRK